ncbi:hypothetical protein NEOLEDRAFT_1199157 [Neolentinus lepideus HHB14362 ss-1]|uniref:Uncharacterized protein n=1 Tax=Neolentinus lepideus HHB14362 ss-1 TaxID=1314782 RepID=A0A165SXE8_9AGAM|nr:hypothetical protein NEOLEDRAFT_1199157 [Neolentinus lepideus HHB14362 ss-1]
MICTSREENVCTSARQRVKRGEDPHGEDLQIEGDDPHVEQGADPHVEQGAGIVRSDTDTSKVQNRHRTRENDESAKRTREPVQKCEIDTEHSKTSMKRTRESQHEINTGEPVRNGHEKASTKLTQESQYEILNIAPMKDPGREWDSCGWRGTHKRHNIAGGVVKTKTTSRSGERYSLSRDVIEDSRSGGLDRRRINRWSRERYGFAQCLIRTRKEN